MSAENSTGVDRMPINMTGVSLSGRLLEYFSGTLSEQIFNYLYDSLRWVFGAGLVIGYLQASPVADLQHKLAHSHYKLKTRWDHYAMFRDRMNYRLKVGFLAGLKTASKMVLLSMTLLLTERTLAFTLQRWLSTQLNEQQTSTVSSDFVDSFKTEKSSFFVNMLRPTLLPAPMCVPAAHRSFCVHSAFQSIPKGYSDYVFFESNYNFFPVFTLFGGLLGLMPPRKFSRGLRGSFAGGLGGCLTAAFMEATLYWHSTGNSLNTTEPVEVKI